MDRLDREKDELFQTDDFVLYGLCTQEEEFLFAVSTNSLQGSHIFKISTEILGAAIKELAEMNRNKIGSATISDTKRDAYIIFIYEDHALRISGKFVEANEENYLMFNQIIEPECIKRLKAVLEEGKI